MTEAQYSLFLSIGTWVSAVGALLNLLKLKRRGNSALILSAAFLAMGSLLWLVKTHSSQSRITVVGVILAALLIADVVVRSRQQEHPR
ncbi:MAG: hypothetical protein ACHQ50_01895 [Fimbriimonadales bacterium]